MTSSSTDPAVLRGTDTLTVRTHTVDTDLRAGAWTRRGGAAVLGDPVTESVLAELAEETRAAARAQGYAVGWSAGHRAGEERARLEAEQQAEVRRAERAREVAEHEQAVAALRAAAQRLQDAVTDVCAAVQSHTVDVALAVAEAVLGREVALAADPGADAVRRALALVPKDAAVTVRLHPQDRAGMDPAEMPGVRLADDATLARGDAVVESDTTVVDATVAAALARVREVLGA